MVIHVPRTEVLPKESTKYITHTGKSHDQIEKYHINNILNILHLPCVSEKVNSEYRSRKKKKENTLALSNSQETDMLQRNCAHWRTQQNLFSDSLWK